MVGLANIEARKGDDGLEVDAQKRWSFLQHEHPTYRLGNLGRVHLATRVARPMADAVDLVHCHTDSHWKEVGVERGSLFREARTYPISSRTVGIVRRARWSFFFDLIVVASRKVVYILRRVSGLHGFPTVLLNISLIYRKLS